MRALFVSILILGLSQPVLAQQKPLTTEEKSYAKVLVQDAAAAFQNKNYREALEDYALAYSLTQEPALLLHIAQCHHNLGEYKDAITYYQSYLDKSRGSISKEEQQEVESLLLEVQELSTQEVKHTNARIDPANHGAEDPLLWALKPSRVSAPYFAVSGLALLSAAVSATFAIQTMNTIEAEAESELVSTQQLKQARTLSLLLATSADVLVLTSAITATVGVLKMRESKRQLSAKASANSLWIQLQY